jgi:hypothetical protein
MPVLNEKPFIDADISEADKKGGVGKLVKMKMKTKVEPTDLNKKGWKITTFEKTPVVSKLYAYSFLSLNKIADVFIPGCLCQWTFRVP